MQNGKNSQLRHGDLDWTENFMDETNEYEVQSHKVWARNSIVGAASGGPKFSKSVKNCPPKNHFWVFWESKMFMEGAFALAPNWMMNPQVAFTPNAMHCLGHPCGDKWENFEAVSTLPIPFNASLPPTVVHRAGAGVGLAVSHVGQKVVLSDFFPKLFIDHLGWINSGFGLF